MHLARLQRDGPVEAAFRGFRRGVTSVVIDVVLTSTRTTDGRDCALARAPETASTSQEETDRNPRLTPRRAHFQRPLWHRETRIAADAFSWPALPPRKKQAATTLRARPVRTASLPPLSPKRTNWTSGTCAGTIVRGQDLSRDVRFLVFNCRAVGFHLREAQPHSLQQPFPIAIDCDRDKPDMSRALARLCDPRSTWSAALSDPCDQVALRWQQQLTARSAQLAPEARNPRTMSRSA